MYYEVIENGSGGFQVRFPYDADLVSQFKAAIPSWHRKWNPESRTWWVHSQSIAKARALLDEFFGCDEDDDDEEPVEASRAAPFASVYATLHLLPTAPPELITAAYRTLAKLSHPDRGGDSEQMTRLNIAYQSLQKHVASTGGH